MSHDTLIWLIGLAINLLMLCISFIWKALRAVDDEVQLLKIQQRPRRRTYAELVADTRPKRKTWPWA